MRIGKSIVFFFQFATVGLAAAFLILFFFPSLVSNGPGNVRPKIVELKQSDRSITQGQSQGMVSYADAVARAQPAVVNIFTQKRIVERTHPYSNDPMYRFFFGDQGAAPRERIENSLGSGVIVSPQGYVITNNHVIANADEIEVALADGRTTRAAVVGTDPETDIALLHIKLDKLPVITLGDSEKLRVGDVVLAIGNPFGVGQTVTSGIVSATGRNMLGINTFENFIQTDAAINPGNSGGALINAWGELIAINTAIFSRSGGSQGIGFAIPISLVKEVMTQIIQHGQVVRGWLGAAIGEINPILAERLGIDPHMGAIVTNLVRNGPADKAGLTRGDIITHINNKPIKHIRELLDIVSQTKPGSVIVIKVYRKGKSFETRATVMQRPVQE
ncbi:MAG: Do family serine endopeptidase [Gammaproteobacteria bacterium]|nr:Do family serine endopeptidase [Gammaproteobacteria bacterium]MDH5653616.1 Do family serine endopeptidase [Gammaproteobacteria bacterium]